MHHLTRRSRILVGILALIVAASALLMLLLRGEPVTGSPRPSEIQVITDDGSSLGQPITTDAVMPAPANESLQQPPTTNDVQQQAPGTDVQEPGSLSQ